MGFNVFLFESKTGDQLDPKKMLVPITDFRNNSNIGYEDSWKGRNKLTNFVKSVSKYEQSFVFFHVIDGVFGKRKELFADCSNLWFVKLSKIESTNAQKKKSDDFSNEEFLYSIEYKGAEYYIKFDNFFHGLKTLYSPPVGVSNFYFQKEEENIFPDSTETMELSIIPLSHNSDENEENVTSSTESGNEVPSLNENIKININFVDKDDLWETVNSSSSDRVYLHSEDIPGGEKIDTDLNEVKPLLSLLKGKYNPEYSELFTKAKRQEKTSVSTTIAQMEKMIAKYGRGFDESWGFVSLINVLNEFFESSNKDMPHQSRMNKPLELFMITSLMDDQSASNDQRDKCWTLHLFTQCAPYTATYYFSTILKIHAMFAYSLDGILNGIVSEENLVSFSEVSSKNSFDYLLRIPEEKKGLERNRVDESSDGPRFTCSNFYGKKNIIRQLMTEKCMEVCNLSDTVHIYNKSVISASM